MVLVALLVCVSVVCGQDEVQVRVGQGTLRGTTHHWPTKYYSYTTIPYARPPVGPLRFKDPEPAEPWAGVREGPKWAPPCPQFGPSTWLNLSVSVSGSEDCLFLDVYTPLPPGSNGSLPVLVWMTMGGLSGGYSRIYQPTPMVTEGVVLVSVQHRANIFGFLSTGDAVVAGNMGLKDQVMALRWVRDNIAQFGGDPTRVTLGGDEGGGVSAHYHVFSPMSKGLFQQVIMHSGVALIPIYYREDQRAKALKLGKLVNCTAENVTSDTLDSAALVDCLMDVSVEDLIMAYWNLGAIYVFPFPMMPGVDGEFLPDHPARLLQRGEYTRVNMLMGVSRDQGTIAIRGGIQFKLTEYTNYTMEQLAEGYGFFPWDDDPIYLVQRAFYEYLPGGIPKNLTAENAPFFRKLAGDALGKVPFYDSMQFHARDSVFGKKVYGFEVCHKGQDNWFDQMYGPGPDYAKDWIIQEEELQYIFDWFMTSKPLTNTQDLFMRRVMLTLWTNFIKHGDPTPDLSLGFRWVAATPTDTQVLALGLTPTMASIDTKAHEFWKNLPMQRNKMLYPERF